MNRVLFLGLLLSTAACGSYKDDLVTMCNARELAGATSQSLDAAQKAMLQATYIDKHLSTGRGRALFDLAASSPDKMKVIGDAAKKEGVDPCPDAVPPNPLSGS